MWYPPNFLFSPVSCFIEYWITWLVTFCYSSRRHHAVPSSPCHRGFPSPWASTGLGSMMIITEYNYMGLRFCPHKELLCFSWCQMQIFFKNLNYGNGTEKLRPKCQAWNNVSRQSATHQKAKHEEAKIWYILNLSKLTFFLFFMSTYW